MGPFLESSLRVHTSINIGSRPSTPRSMNIPFKHLSLFRKSLSGSGLTMLPRCCETQDSEIVQLPKIEQPYEQMRETKTLPIKKNVKKTSKRTDKRKK